MTSETASRHADSAETDAGHADHQRDFVVGVTYANGNTEKTWIVRDGKVTSTDKGYYYFWDENKHYVQTPMENTFVEEF